MARRSGIFAGGAAALVLVAGVAASSAGGAPRADAVVEANGYELVWSKSIVPIAVGESVTWRWNTPEIDHDLVSDSPNWKFEIPTGRAGNGSLTFTQAGTYKFRCEYHSEMKGEVIVGTSGEPSVTPSPSASPTASPTTTASPSPTPTATPITPAATPVSTPVVGPPPPPEPEDTVKPKLTSISTKAAKAGVQVRFKLSESAAVKVTVKRGSKTLKTVTKQFAAGTRMVTAKGSKITRGKVTVEIRATDAAGNASSLTRRSVSIKS